MVTLTMKRYDFEIWQGGATSTVERNVAIADATSLWARIGGIAKRISTSDGFIKVTDEVGGIVVLVGATSAIYLCAARFPTDAFHGLPSRSGVGPPGTTPL